MNYLILDAAIMEGEIEIVKKFDTPQKCLYAGDAATQLVSVAPFLFKVDPENRLIKWFSNREEKNKWGVLITAKTDFETLHRHFRKFLIVKTDKGKKLYLRFYDPRVLADFLKTCNPDQLKTFFGPISNFTFWNEDDEKKELKIEKDNLVIS